MNAIDEIREIVNRQYVSPKLKDFVERGDLDGMYNWSLDQLRYPESRSDDCDPRDIGRLGSLADKILELQRRDAALIAQAQAMSAQQAGCSADKQYGLTGV